MEKGGKRGFTVYRILGILLIIELGVLFYHSGIVEGLDHRADKLKAYAIASREDAAVLPGDFYDRNGVGLAETEWKTIKETGQKVKHTTYRHGRAYSQLLGYTGNLILDLSAESAEDVVKGRADYRLMAFLDEDYWGENGLYRTAGPDGRKGQSAALTLDHDLQLCVYDALAAQMNESHARGSAVVLDVKTGEILSMAAFPTYDFNNLADAVVQMDQAEKETDLEPGYPVSHKGPAAPGSIFKILTAAALIEHGMEDFTAVDEPFYVDGWKCENAYASLGDPITYYEGIERSSNVFFARAALALGTDRLKETAEKFLLFQEGSYNSFDFGNVPYHWNLDVPDDILAQTGFGQGKTELTTVHAAMIAQAVANDGILLEPYLIQKLTDEKGKDVYTGKIKTVGKVMEPSTADKITKAMLAAVKYNMLHHKLPQDTVRVLEMYQVAGKTGTAQTGDADDSNHAWFLSFAPADEPRYVVAVNQCRTDKAGYQMMETAAAVYEYLFQQ